MNGLDTPIPLLPIAAWAALAVGVLVLSLVPFRGVVGGYYRGLLLALRLAALAVLLLLLLQPYRTIRTPDRTAFQVVVLADCSHSMTVTDCASGTARFGVLRAALDANAPDSLIRRLASRYRLRTILFAEEHQPKATRDIGLMPGRTALGTALKACLQESGGTPLGAVLVLSDGQSNTGLTPPEAGKLLRNRGVPVSCVGIGENRRQGDVAVRFASDRLSAVKGEPCTVRVTVSNSLPDAVSTRVVLTEGMNPIASQDVELAAGAPASTIEFTYTPWRAGFQTLAARLRPVAGDTRPDTDTDYAGLKVSEPDTFRLLYLSAQLNWEFKFLRDLADASEQLSLAAVIQTGRNSFYSTGLPEDAKEPGFPRRQALINRFDAILLDTRAIPLLPPETLAALEGFVDHRGGGLLCFGPLPAADTALSALLPVKGVSAVSPNAPLRFEVLPGFIFTRDAEGVLRSPRGLTLAGPEPAYVIDDMKMGARAAAVVTGSDKALLAAQSYGSGRVAYLGIENTWRWRLASNVGRDAHEAFWNRLLVWLASTSRQRLTAPCAGSKTAVGEQVRLDLNVLGTDFQPAPDARIACTVAGPSGKRQDIALDPSAEAPGRYTALFFPEEAGEYTVSYRIRLPTESLEFQAPFMARRTGVEMEDTDYADQPLRDLARLTHGSFWPYTDLPRIAELPLSNSVPMRAERQYWTRSWFLLALLAGLLCADWYCRRRIGLK